MTSPSTQDALNAPPSGAKNLNEFPYTSFPNALLDHIMPTLSGSEWQLLCVIIRQTQGWHDPHTGGRKKSDWLSHQQLKARTGRGSDAVCHAIETLVRRGHIEVKDEQGHVLATPQERRRNGSRLFYEIGAPLHSYFASEQLLKENLMPDPFRQARFGKAETTKETLTKTVEQAFGKPQTSSFPSGGQCSKVPKKDGCGCLTRSQADLQLAPSPPHDSVPSFNHPEEVRRIVAAYRNLANDGKPPNGHFNTSLNQEYIERLEKALSRYGEEQLLTLLKAFFESDFSLMKRNSSFASFVDSVHILAARRPKNHFVARSS